MRNILKIFAILTYSLEYNVNVIYFLHVKQVKTLKILQIFNILC